MAPSKHYLSSYFHLLEQMELVMCYSREHVRGVILVQQNGTHSNGVSGVGSMVISTRHHRLERGDAIPIRE